MIDSTPFRSFSRPPVGKPAMAPAPLPVPVTVVALAKVAPPFQSDSLANVAAAADQLGLAELGVITLQASLPGHPPAPLAGQTGLYRPDAADDQPVGEPETGLATGTLVLTARGEVPVEALQPGDWALGLRGPALLRIRWIGRTSAGKPGVRIEAGALGPDVPRRALRLAADHPVFVQPSPVPARNLVNGGTIQAVALDGVELFQVDVGASDVLFAEGMALASDRRATA